MAQVYMSHAESVTGKASTEQSAGMKDGKTGNVVQKLTRSCGKTAFCKPKRNYVNYPGIDFLYAIPPRASAPGMQTHLPLQHAVLR